MCRFNGSRFRPFPIPEFEDLEGASGVDIRTEDAAGNLWFSSGGLGVCKYDGTFFTRYTTADGLCDNNVVCIVQGKHGNMWFSSMFGGLSKYDGRTFTNFNTANGTIGNDEVWTMRVDRSGDIWFSSEGYGVYRYNGLQFSNYSITEGLGVLAVQTVLEDDNGRIWVGGGGGLYRLEGDRFVNVRRNGPWPVL